MKRSVLSIKILSLASIISLALVLPAYAQGVPSTIGGLDLSPSTNSPAPGQEVTITAKSYSVDINAASLTWTAEGKVLAKGVGVTTLVVKAPALGKKLTINVSVISGEGVSISGSITLSSGSIDLIIEPSGYVPPFFKGKTPVAYQNSVKIIAVPHLANSAGVEYDPKTLVYKWQKNDSVLESQSGYGKQSVTIPGNIIPRPYDVEVTVTSRDGIAQSVALASISASSPSITFYRNDPLYGPLLNRALGKNVYLVAQRETGVLAVPYGFNLPATGLGDLSLTWLINGIKHPELAYNRSVTLRTPGQTAGSSNVQLNIENKKDILQYARGSFSAIFSTSASSTDSGLF